MHITPAHALPFAVALASLVTGVLTAPPANVAGQRVDAASAAAVPVDGGGPLDLSLPGDLPVAPTSTPLDPQLGDLTGTGGEVTNVPPAAGGDVTVVPAVAVTSSAAGIPGNVLVAYRRAAQTMAVNDPACHLPWPVLAGIGKVESGHARGGALDSTGRTLAPILGPVLSGGPGLAAIADSDGGRWDGDVVWDRAVGPMQFIPSSWRAHAVDGGGDGSADPSNIYDSTLAAAGYLCTGERDLSRATDLQQAVFGYNHSQVYVDTVLAWAQAYSGGGALAIAPVSGGGATVVLATNHRNGGAAATATPRPKPTRSPAGVTPPPTAAGPTMTPAPNPAMRVAAAIEPTTTSSVSAAPSPSSTPSDLPSPVGTGCPTATATPTDSATPTPTPTDSPTPTPTATDPSATPSPSPTPTDPCATPSPSPTATGSATPSPSPTVTATPTP